MLPSPYAPGSLPGYLAGRGVELELIGQHLARTRALGRSGGPLLAFAGSRGLGKTSLLRAAQREADSAGYLTVWVTGRNDEPMAPTLARAVTDQVRRSPVSDATRALLSSLDKIEVGVPGLSVGVERNSAVRHEPTIEQRLAEVGRWARQHDRHGLAVFVDEFQEAQLADRRSLLIALQHFDGDPDGVPVAIIAAGLPSLLGAVPEAATFGERTRFVEVGLLGEVAVAEALRLPAEAAGVSWSDDGVLRAIEAAGGYPHRVQLIGDGAWAAARPDPGDTVSAGHVDRGVEEADRQMTVLFRSRLMKLSAELRRFLSAMAGVAVEAGPDGAVSSADRPVPRVDIAARLGVTSTAISRARDELIDRGLVEAAGRGLLRFTVPGFGAFVHGFTDPDDLTGPS